MKIKEVNNNGIKFHDRNKNTKDIR
jgi:hypothetical protein